MKTCYTIDVDENVDENTVWQSAHGVRTRIKDMDDTYLANLRDYLTKRIQLIPVLAETASPLIAIIDKLVKERGLKKEFLNRAQIPYKNPKGQWEIWDFEKFCPMTLQEDKQ